MKQMRIETPLGVMVAKGDAGALYYLDFIERCQSEDEPQGTNATLELIKHELELYFDGKLIHFHTPLAIEGTPFRKRVWGELMKIPYGETISYAQLAESIGQPTAFRAVAQANGANNFAIVIPCHRVINKNGSLGGYGGGLPRKEWLLQHEVR